MDRLYIPVLKAKKKNKIVESMGKSQLYLQSRFPIIPKTFVNVKITQKDLETCNLRWSICTSETVWKTYIAQNDSVGGSSSSCGLRLGLCLGMVSVWATCMFL